MKKEQMEQDTRAKCAYAPPRVEIYEAEPGALLVGTNFGNDPGSADFTGYFTGGGNAGGASFGTPLSGSGSAGGASSGGSLSGGGSSAGAANLVTGAKGGDFGVSFSDVWGE